MIYLKETATRIIIAGPPKELEVIGNHFRYRPPDYWRSPRYQLYKETGGERGWNGFVYPASRQEDGTLIIGRGHRDELLSLIYVEEFSLDDSKLLHSPFQGLTVNDIPDNLLPGADFELDLDQRICIISLLQNAIGCVHVSVSGGKTAIFFGIAALVKIRQPEVRCLYLVPSERLVKQVTLEGKRFLPDWHITQFGGGKDDDTGKDVVVATVSILNKRFKKLLLSGWFRTFTILMVDECFPCNTQVNGRRISDILPGDRVPSYNHQTGCIELRKVTRIFRSKPSAMCRLTLSNGKTLLCTPGHPLWTGTRYTPAILCLGEKVVYLIDDKEDNRGSLGVCSLPRYGRGEIRQETLLSESPSGVRGSVCVLRRLQTETTQKSCAEGSEHIQLCDKKIGCSLQQLWEACKLSWRTVKTSLLSTVGGCSEGACLLFRRMQESLVHLPLVFYYETNKYTGSCHYFGSNEDKQPILRPRNLSPNRAKIERACNGSSCWKWLGVHEVATYFKRSSKVGELIHRIGVSGPVPSPHTCGGGASSPKMPHDRHCATSVKDSDRSGWLQPHVTETEATGRVENSTFKRARVDRVEILEWSSGAPHSDVCPDGFVYNIEVEGNHNYFADGILVHNCHHLASGKSWQEVVRRIPAFYRFGASDSLKNEREEDLGLAITLRGFMGPERHEVEVGTLINSKRVAKPYIYLIHVPEWNKIFEGLPHTPEPGSRAWALIDGEWRKGTYVCPAFDVKVNKRDEEEEEQRIGWQRVLIEGEEVEVESRWCLLKRAYDEGIIRFKERNQLIVQWAKHFSEQGKPTLIVATRTPHVYILQTLLEREGLRPRVLTGMDSTAERDDTFKWLVKTPGAILISPIVKEGVSLPELRAGIVADPVASPDLARQIIGRFIRKKVVGVNEAEIVMFIDSQYKSARSNSQKLIHELESIRGYSFYYPCQGPDNVGPLYAAVELEPSKRKPEGKRR